MDLKHDSKLVNWHRKTLVSTKVAVKLFEAWKKNLYLMLSKLACAIRRCYIASNQ